MNYAQRLIENYSSLNLIKVNEAVSEAAKNVKPESDEKQKQTETPKESGRERSTCNSRTSTPQNESISGTLLDFYYSSFNSDE